MSQSAPPPHGPGQAGRVGSTAPVNHPDAPSGSERPSIRRRAVIAWGLWDWGSAAWQAVITSFVFGPYVVQGVVGDARPGGLSGNTWLGISTALAGLVIAAVAPITGQRGDAGGKRRRSLAIWTALVVATMLALFTIKDRPEYLWSALILLGAGAVLAEFAYVHYNAMLRQVCTPATLGRVSGFGWAMGTSAASSCCSSATWASSRPRRDGSGSPARRAWPSAWSRFSRRSGSPSSPSRRC
jgi:MFS transporter, UMF1 family